MEQKEEKDGLTLETALAVAEAVNQSKSPFLSSMSHDIRTPMNAIMGMTAIALSHIDEKARVQDCLDKVRTASSHMICLVNDVLDMFRIDSGRMDWLENVIHSAQLYAGIERTFDQVVEEALALERIYRENGT